MKTSVMEVHDMLSVLSVDGVEMRIGEVPGVESVTVNHAAGSATVRYDETRLDIADIRSEVRQSGYEADTSGAASKSGGHEGHAAPGAPPATPAPKPPSAMPAATTAPKDAAPEPTPATPEAVPETNADAPARVASGGDEPQNKPAAGKS